MNSEKNFYLKKLLEIIGLVAFAVAMYAILTYGQTYIHADSALGLRFYNAIKNSHSLYPRTWNAANGEIYTFDTLPFALIAAFFMKDMVIARVVATAMSYGLACAGVIWLSKRVFKNGAWTVILPLFCVFLCSPNTRDMLLCQAAYCPEMVALTWAVGLFYLLTLDEYSKQKKTLFLVVHSILLFLMLTRGVRYIAEYLLPLCLTIGFYELIIEKRHGIKDIWVDCRKPILLLGIPSVIGYVMYAMLSRASNMNYSEVGSVKFASSIRLILDCVKSVFVEAAVIFGYSPDKPLYLNIAIWIVAMVAFIVFPLLQCLEYKKLTKPEQFFLIFGLFHNLVLISALVLCVKTSSRYMLSSVFVAIIISGDYIYRKIQSVGKSIAIVISALFVVIAMIYTADLLKLTAGWPEKVANQREVAQTLMDEGVTKVYATYWVGYPYETYSNNELTVGAVDVIERSFKAYYWLVDDHVYRHKDGKSCVLLTADEDAELYAEGDVNPIGTRVGLEYERIEIPGAYIYDFYERDVYTSKDLVAYIFDEDISDKISNGFRDGLLQPREMYFNYLGAWAEDEIVLTLGGIVHGPYLPIEAGHYRVKINGSNLNVCGGAVVSEQSPQLIDWKFVSEEDNCKEIDMNISNKVDDIQFFLNNPTEETALFYNVTIEKID